MPNPPKRRWIGPVIVTVVLFAATMLAFWSWQFSRWSDLRVVPAQEASMAFDEAIREAGGGPPYIEFAVDGSVGVRRDLESDRPVGLESLNLLAWEPEGGRLLRVRFPYWFVRAKMTDSLNIGTLTTALARDWEHLDLKVSEEDLERRGPGLVLDRTLAGGERLLLWTE